MADFYAGRSGPVDSVVSAMEKTNQTVCLRFGSKEGAWQHGSGLDEDPRWQLAQRIVESSHFNKSPRLSQFLLYIVAKCLEGRHSEVTEQQIGVHVFGRPQGYRTVDDNIVRNYARQLRKRLTEYFAGDGTDHAMRIEIPLGGYMPAFIGPSPAPASTQHVLVGRTITSKVDDGFIISRRGWPRMLACTCLLIAYSAALIWLTCTVQARVAASRKAPEPGQPMWLALAEGKGDTYIVPPDAGLNLLEDMSHQPLPLADYLRGGYLDLPLPGVDPHSEADLRTQRLTGFLDLQLIVTLARLSEYSRARVLLRFPRDLRFDDLKSANAVIIGSSCSNPWAVIAESASNFKIHCNSGLRGSTVVNLKPQLGEAASYNSHSNEPTHETYAVISFVPNLSGYGHLLFLAGLDAAGTQAAEEALLCSETMAPILEQARRPDGSLAGFEVLLRSTSIQANATDTHVIAIRIH